MTETVADPALLRRRLRSQLLAGPRAPDALTVTRRLLAVQAQDARAARLAIRARTSGGSAAEIDRALTDERSLVITWANRGTLHLIAAEDHHWLHALTTPVLRAGSARRLAQEGVDPAMAERAVRIVVDALGDDGPLTRAQLRDRLDAAGVPTAGQALIHVLLRATIDGHVVRGPMRGRQHAYVLTRDWIGEAAPIDRDVALAELARRYLAGHAPATERDLARWAGLPLRDARAGLRAIAGDLHEGEDGMLSLHSRPRAVPLPAPRLLGGWEPALVGWTSRTWLLGAHDPAIVTGGLFRNFALADGRPVATWRFDGPHPVIDPLEPLDDELSAALHRDATALGTYLSG